MPSPTSIAQIARDLTSTRSRLALGAGAASVATLGSLIGLAAASTGPAVSFTGSLAAAHSPVLASAAAISPSLHARSAPDGPQAADSPPVTIPQLGGSQQPAAAASQPAAAAAATGGPVNVGIPPQPAAPALPVAAPAPQPPQPAPQPYTIYDSVTPSSLPSSSQAVAVYADGHYAAAPSQVGKRGLVLWIDTNASDTRADVLDVEPGDASPPQAASWVAQKLDATPNSVAIVYTMKSDWGAVQGAINALPWWMPSHTRYWIADPTGFPHLVPGSQATQWYWGQSYDMSTAAPNF